MRKTIVILSALALLAIPAFGQWHSDWRISNTSGSSYTSYTGGWGTAADADNVHIAWYDYTTSQRIRYVGFPIGSPPAAGSGDAVSTSYGYSAVVATDGANAQVAWDYSNRVYFRENSGGWGSILSSSYGYTYPAITNDAAGNTHYAMNTRSYRGRRVYYMRRNAGAGSLTSYAQVHYPGYYRYSYYPSICVTSDGVIHMSFGTNQSGSNYYALMHAYSTNNGASWTVERLTGTYACYYSYKTSICADSDDNLYIAYTSYYTPRHIFVISGTTGSWGTPVQVDQSTYNYVYYPSICCDTFNNVWVCWDDRSGSNYEIYYNKMDGGTGSWDGPQPLTSDDGQYSRRGQLAADEHGGVHISWYDRRDGNYEIYYNWFTTGGGGPGGRDLVCVKINQPLGKIPPDPITPKAVIKNNGGDIDSGYAICEITGPGANYDEGNIEGILELEPGQEDQVEFPSWTPPGGPGDKYEVRVTVYLWPEKTTEDDDPLNNTKVEYATIEGGAQVDPIMIAMPELGGTYYKMSPEATFQNVGSDPATDFYCYCEINSVAFFTEPYIDSFAVANLDPEATIDVTFADWVCDDSLAYEALFFAAVPGAVDRDLLGIEELVGFNGMPGIAESPDALRIEVSGPNPFVHGTLLSYNMNGETPATIRIYDASGQAVRTLHDGALSGEGSLYWDGTDDVGRKLGAGLYFIRIATPLFTKTAKVVLVN
jgi:hypothetical protein